MNLKLLKLTLISGFTLSLLILSEYNCYSSHPDKRSFTSQQSRVSSFGAPNVHSSPHGRTPMTVQTHENNRMQATPYTHHQEHQRAIQTYFYDYNPVYPTYTYPTDDGSYYYSTPLNDTNDEQNYNADNSTSSLPEGTWTAASDGSVPDQAFVYQTQNGSPTYYCRVEYNNDYYYGVLTPNVGCYIQDQSAIIRFNQYDVLISSQ